MNEKVSLYIVKFNKIIQKANYMKLLRLNRYTYLHRYRLVEVENNQTRLKTAIPTTSGV